MHCLRVIEIIITLFITLELGFSLQNAIESKVSYDDNYCKKICLNFRYCNRICSERVRNPSTDSISLPHCGLTQLNRRTVGINSRIVYGKVSKANRHPWIVSIQTIWKDRVMNGTTRQHSCGGAIINSRFILTAAHCCYSPNGEIRSVQIGSNNISKREINGINQKLEIISKNTTMILHEKFVYKPMPIEVNDICLMKTSKPIEFIVKDNKFVVNSICLPEINSEQYGEVVIAGWGNVNPNLSNYFEVHTPETLQEDKYIILDKQTCGIAHKEIYPPFPIPGFDTIFDNKTMICTVAKSSPKQFPGIYFGDSGSPVIQYHNNRAYTIGLVCGLHYKVPSVARHTQVSKFIDWIENNINKYS